MNEKDDTMPLSVVKEMLTAIDGEIGCAQYHLDFGDDNFDTQIGRKIIAKIVHNYCDKFVKGEHR